MDGSVGTTIWQVALLGMVNWVATYIVVDSLIFKDLRELVDGLGNRVAERFPRIGEKIRYFLACALCVGVWIGFLQALVFGGPLQPQVSWLSWAAFIANGLLYKSIGHLLLQVNALYHYRVALAKWQEEAEEQDVLLKKNENRILSSDSNTSAPEHQRAA